MREDFREPYRSQFAELIREGAGTKDIQDNQSGRFAEQVPAYEALIEREVRRVEVHRASLCRLIEPVVGACPRILDLGCGTGATTVAMGLSERLAAQEVIGLDPNELSINAARVRAAGYERTSGRVRFERVGAGSALQYADNHFDLSVCVSVLEYLRNLDDRRKLVSEMIRVTKPGGFIVMITPNPYRILDYHTHRLLGDWRRTEGFPWASPPGELRAMFPRCSVKFLRSEQIACGLRNRGLPGAGMAWLAWPLAFLLDWQKVLARKQ